MSNPFDDEEGEFLVLKNAQGEYCLWPTFAAVPAGWTAVNDPADRASCLQYVEGHWAGPCVGSTGRGAA